MKRISRAVYTVEYKVAAVHQVLGGKKVAEVARELGVVEQTLHNWIRSYRAGKLGDGTGKQVSPEQMENSKLRAELARTKMELEIVKNVWSAPDLQALIISEQKSVCVNVSGLLVQHLAAGLDGIRALRAP